MTITVLLFASYADALGTPELNLVLPAGSTVRDAVREVTGMQAAGPLPAEPLVAVNERYAKLDQPLMAGDELALIPPVAGG